MTVVVDVHKTVRAWRTLAQVVPITSDRHIEGNSIVKPAKEHDDSCLIILGSARCRDLIAHGCAAFFCSEVLTEQEAIVCTAMGSVTEVARDVPAQVLDSGSCI